VAGRRLIAASILVTVAGVTAGLVVAADGSGAPGRRGGQQDTSSTSEPPSTSTTTTPVPVPVGTYQVASTSLALSEPVSSAVSRSLPTALWFPAPVGSAGGRRHGPYPLLVFSQGYATPVDAYQVLLEDWASAGFVVAAPTYPRTDPADPAGLDENDIVNHPADLRFVVTALLQQSQQRGSALAGLIDPNEIGLVGQSDGGDVSLAVADNSCCADSRVKAAAILSGAELASFGGTYFSGAQVPLLVVQGDADTVNPPGCSTQIYDGARPPKWYLDLFGAAHLPPYTDPGTDQNVIAKVTTDFFDAELAGQSAGLTAMPGDGNLSGVAQLSDGPSAPAAPPGCPGAP
jgi:dienelactone hydrolase